MAWAVLFVSTGGDLGESVGLCEGGHLMYLLTGGIWDGAGNAVKSRKASRCLPANTHSIQGNLSVRVYLDDYTAGSYERLAVPTRSAAKDGLRNCVGALPHPKPVPPRPSPSSVPSPLSSHPGKQCPFPPRTPGHQATRRALRRAPAARHHAHGQQAVVVDAQVHQMGGRSPARTRTASGAR